MVTHEIALRLELLYELKEQRDEMDAQIRALEDSVKNEMDAHGVSVLKVGEREVKYTRFFSTRFDTKSFKAEHTELYDQYMVPVPTSWFTLR